MFDATVADDDPVKCPHCGHSLSMYSEPEPDRGERAAAAVTSVVATWWFPTLLVVLIVIWLGINVALRPMEPFPMLMLAGLAAVLSSLSALQAPLILLAQRRSRIRDRALEREIFRIVAHNEADMHTIRLRLDEIWDQVEPGGPRPDRG